MSASLRPGTRSLLQRAFRIVLFFFFSSRRRHTRYWRDWSSDVCSSDLKTRSGERGFKIFDDEIGIDIPAARFFDHAGRQIDAVEPATGSQILECFARQARSEERRVGEEGRSRWSPYH